VLIGLIVERTHLVLVRAVLQKKTIEIVIIQNIKKKKILYKKTNVGEKCESWYFKVFPLPSE